MSTILKKYLLGSQISALKARVPCYVAPTATILSVLQLLKDKSIGSVLVRQGSGPLLGIFTERDCITKLVGSGLAIDRAPVSDIMSQPVVAERGNASIARLVHTITSKGIRHVPVILRKDEYGIVSIKDLVDFFYKVLTRKLVEADPALLVDDGAVDAFFTSSVSEVSPDKPVCLAGNRSVADALEIMRRERIGSILVKTIRGPLEGIFTERDYLSKGVFLMPDPHSVPLSSVMTPKPCTVLESASVSIAFNHMSEGGFRHIPVVNSNEDLCGVLSARSFVTHLSGDILEDLSG